MTRSLLILHEKCNKPSEEPDWVQWHLDTHEPDLVAATGAEHVTFWQLAREAAAGHAGPRLLPRHDPRVRRRARAIDVAGVLASLRAKRSIHPTHTVMDAQRFVAHGRYNDKPEPTERAAAGTSSPT